MPCMWSHQHTTYLRVGHPVLITRGNFHFISNKFSIVADVKILNLYSNPSVSYRMRIVQFIFKPKNREFTMYSHPVNILRENFRIDASDVWDIYKGILTRKNSLKWEYNNELDEYHEIFFIKPTMSNSLFNVAELKTCGCINFSIKFDFMENQNNTNHINLIISIHKFKKLIGNTYGSYNGETRYLKYSYKIR
ncbi:hypothetical protein HZS_4036 [Henneguya salminicola]|nr:hypothetical protein HZS_4036 [Henneguya salminicola]